jgi:hypothetical protein
LSVGLAREEAFGNPDSAQYLQAARYVFAVATETGVGRALASIRLTGAASVEGVRRAKALKRTAVESMKSFMLQRYVKNAKIRGDR